MSSWHHRLLHVRSRAEEVTRLIITADDLGLSPGVTRGVLDAYRHGVVRSTSLLVTFPASEEGAELARVEAGLEVGLHLDLVGGWPAGDATRVRSLVNAEGRFWGLGEFVARITTGRVRTAEVARELRSQVERARAWGTPALAWDSHRHVHVLPPVARIVGALARESGARWIRRPTPPLAWRSPKALVLKASTLVASGFLRGIPGNDWFVDLSSWQRDAATVARLATYRQVGELSAHPGHPDNDLRILDPMVDERTADLALLCHPLLRAAFADRPVSWRVPA